MYILNVESVINYCKLMGNDTFITSVVYIYVNYITPFQDPERLELKAEENF